MMQEKSCMNCMMVNVEDTSTGRPHQIKFSDQVTIGLPFSQTLRSWSCLAISVKYLMARESSFPYPYILSEFWHLFNNGGWTSLDNFTHLPQLNISGSSQPLISSPNGQKLYLPGMLMTPSLSCFLKPISYPDLVVPKKS